MISARCVAHDLHKIAPGPLERTCWRRFAAQWGDCTKSQIAPLNAITIIIIIIIITYCKCNLMRINWGLALLALSCHPTKPWRASQRRDKPWLAKGQTTDQEFARIIFHIWKGSTHTWNVLPHMCFQYACSWYATHFSSPLSSYTVRADTTLVCKAFYMAHLKC